MERILFARVGYMTYYAGPQAGDERPVGGGAYNRDNVGLEIYNFKAIGDRLYGFFQPYLKNTLPHNETINLTKVDPLCNDDYLEDVTVIFFSSDPAGGGQVVVGWYQGAKVYHERRLPSSEHLRGEFEYFIDAPLKRALLLPTSARDHRIAGAGIEKQGRPGQANAFYLYKKDGSLRQDEWISQCLDYVRSYQGGNLLVNPEVESDGESAVAAEKVYADSTGQSFNSSVNARRAIECYSMERAKKCFINQGYKFVEDISRNHSIDLRFEDAAGQRLDVEVKGTQTCGSSIFLTKNEVDYAQDKSNNCALYVLHSIELTELKSGCKCTGGEEKILNPWLAEADALRVVTYQYKFGG